MQRFEDLQPKWDWMRISLAGFAPNVGFVSVYDPKILPHRLAYISCVLGAMITNILINTMFLQFMTTQFFENHIKSFDEIISNDFELAGDRFALYHLMEQPEVRITQYFLYFLSLQF